MVEAVVAGGGEVEGELVDGESGAAEGLVADGPYGGDPGESGEGDPLGGEVVVDEFFAGALEAGFAVFEGEESGVSDEDGGVVVGEHGVEVGCVGDEGCFGVPPLAEEDLGVGEGGLGAGVGGDGADVGERLGGAADEQDGADACAGSDGAAGDEAEVGVGGQGGDGDEADVGGVGRVDGVFEARGAFCGHHVVAGIAAGELCVEGWVFEVPHEGCGIEEAYGGDAQPGGIDLSGTAHPSRLTGVTGGWAGLSRKGGWVRGDVVFCEWAYCFALFWAGRRVQGGCRRNGE